MSEETIEALVARLADRLLAARALLATAESCTGGLLAAACTSLAGSSRWFERGFVTYSNEAKVELLGVDAALIATHGAVSSEVAQAMARGAIVRSRASVGVAVTGIAGPDGGSAEKPVGTVWIATALRADDGPATTRLLRAKGDRTAVRVETVRTALGMLLEYPAVPGPT